MRRLLFLATATVLIPLSGFAASKSRVHKRAQPAAASARKGKSCSNDEAVMANFDKTAGAAVRSSAPATREGSLSEAATRVIIGAGFPNEFYQEYNDMYNTTTYYISSRYICHIYRSCHRADIYEPSSGCDPESPVDYDVTCAPKLKNRVCPD